MSRYNVGQKYLFVRTVFHCIDPDDMQAKWVRLYMPWLHKLDRVEFLILECIEHHKVAWDQDPNGEKKYDGFVFRRVGGNYERGNIWCNQYPHAAYGQLDDSNDRLIRRADPAMDPEGFSKKQRALWEEKDYDRFFNKLRKTEQEDFLFEPFTDGEKFFARLKRAINQNGLFNEEQKQQMEKFQLLMQLEISKMGMSVEYGPFIFHRTTGEAHELPGHYSATIKFAE